MRKGFRQIMGGVGSGRKLDGEPRRLVERCFVLDVERVLEAGREPGTLSDIEIWAPLIVWPVKAIVLIEITEKESHRRAYFLCPGQDHRRPERRFTKLYWPVGDSRGFACRDCHRLAYWTSQSRRPSPLHIARA